MKDFRIVFIFSFALLFLLGCSKETIQPDPLDSSELNTLKGAKAQKGKIVKSEDCIKLHGTFHIKVDEVLQKPPPMPKILRSIGEGNLIHLGKTKVKLIQAWVPVLGTTMPPIPPWKGQGWSTCYPDKSGECHVTFKTEHGEFYATYGSPTPPFGPLVPGNAISFHKTLYHVEVSFTGVITGGTGVFENATGGEFTWNVIYNPETNKGVAKIRGQVIL